MAAQQLNTGDALANAVSLDSESESPRVARPPSAGRPPSAQRASGHGDDIAPKNASVRLNSNGSPMDRSMIYTPPTLGEKTMTFRKLKQNDSFRCDSDLHARGQLGSKEKPEVVQMAYGKDSVIEGDHFQKKIMKRVFDSLDPTHSGTLGEDDIKLFFKRIGSGALTEEETDKAKKILFANGPPSFEYLWTCWSEDKFAFDVKTQANFKLMSSRFAESFHQHQLLIKEEGEKFTQEYRVWFYLKSLNSGEERVISPWHDIPLYVKDVVRTDNPTKPLNKYNFICEIPKWTRAKFEIATIEPYNPIKQDVSKGALRFYKHGDMLFNYGAFPQTWESTEHSFIFTEGDEGEAYKGDNDPVDVIEIGTQQLLTGSVTAVKVLGCLGMVDDGEMDWKVIAISLTDPLAMFMDDIADVNRYMPGALDSLRAWLRDYKICTGKPENIFVFDGEYFSCDYAKDVIKECHNHWRKFHLITDRTTV